MALSFKTIGWDGKNGKGLPNFKTEPDVLGLFVWFRHLFLENPHIGFITYCSQQAIIRQVGRPSNQYACYQLDDNYYYCLLLLFLLTRLYSKGSM